MTSNKNTTARESRYFTFTFLNSIIKTSLGEALKIGYMFGDLNLKINIVEMHYIYNLMDILYRFKDLECL